MWRMLAFLVSVPALGCSDRASDDASSDPSTAPGDTSTVTSSATTTTASTTTVPPSTGDGTPIQAAGSERGGNALRWAPPEQWQDYERVELPREGGRLRLASDVDYLLSADQPIVGQLEIIGGRDIVWIGGEIVIERPERADSLHRAVGLLVRDDDDSVERTVHLEGLFLGGSGLNDGINVDAPSAIVQVQNVHVALVTFDGADDRDGTGSFDGEGRNHPDVLQPYGGHRELRVDGLSATSAYQGLFLKIDHPDSGRGTVRLRNVDVRAVEITGVDGVDYAGNRMYFWDAATIGDQFIENGTVWIQHHPNAGKVAGVHNERENSGGWWHGAYRDGDEFVVEPPPGNAGPADAVERLSAGEPVIEPRVGVDRHGRYLWWPASTSDGHSDVRDADGHAPGRLHIGTPPGGPYVPRSSVGLGYRPPGYATDEGSGTR
jgi:hypothetical protein